MYQYPLSFSFPAFSVSPQITIKGAQGTVILNAAKKPLFSKEEIHVTRDNQPAYLIISQENRITDLPSNWDIKDAAGNTLAVIDDDFLSAVDTSKFISNSVGSSLADTAISRSLNMSAVKMYWIFDTYVLEVEGKFTIAEESILLNSILLTLVCERQRLKDMYS